MPTDYWTLIKPVWDAISIYEGGDRFLSDFEKAPEVSRALFAAHWCQSEVCNGGFHQFYSNSTGVLAPEAIDAFARIGMANTAAIVSQSMSWFDSPYPRDRAVRENLLDFHAKTHSDDPNPFDALDDPFFKLLEAEAGGFETAANAYAELWQKSRARR